MSIKFEVYGEPRGKQRPRMCKTNDKMIVYTPKQTRDYEKRVRACYKAVSKDFFDKNIPIEIDIKAYFSTPQNVTNNLKDNISFEEMYSIKPPDLDNIAKIVCDALNGVAFYDDRQVCKLNIEKCYAITPKVIVELRALEVSKH